MSATASLLLIAPAEDDHGQAVLAALDARNCTDYARLDVANGLERLRLTWHGEADAEPHWVMEGLDGPCPRVDSRRLRSVWLRRWVCNQRFGTRSEGDETPGKLLPDDANELFQACQLVILQQPGEAFPLGHPHLHQRAENKPWQLAVARRVGFSVPATIYSSDRAELATFARAHPTVVVKPLSSSSFIDEDGTLQPLRARSYSGEGLAELIDGDDRPTQLYLQEAIRKVADLRITVIPGACWCCEIDTATLPEGDPDWRSWHDSFPHRILPVEAEFERQLREFLAAMELTAGYFDFALLGDGRRVFFEVNTNAEWFWVQRLTGAPIAASIAEALLAPLSRPTA